MFVANSANLMRSIQGVLKASKNAQALHNNHLSTDTETFSTTPKPHPQSSAMVQQLLTSTSPTHIPPSPSLLASLTHFTHTGSPHGQISPPATLLTPPPAQPPAAISCPDTIPLDEPFLQTPPPPAQPPAHVRPLRIEDTAEVCRWLYPLRAKWKTIGTFLCIDHGSLDAIKKDCAGSDDQLTELIAVWLKQLTPPPTWQALHQAVLHLDPTLAQRIQDKIEKE